MKKIFLVIMAVVLFGGDAFGATWCKWNDPIAENCRRDRGGLLQIDDDRFVRGEVHINAHGYFKRVNVLPPLTEGNMYTDYSFSFDGSVITATRNQAVNPNAPTLNDHKINKYQQMRDVADQEKSKDCSFSGFTIPPATRSLMVEAISANKTVTYEVINESTGFYQGFERTPAQAQAVLDACLDDYETANQKLYVDNPDSAGAGDSLIEDIKTCVDKACIDAIDWNYKLVPTGT